VDKQAQVNVQMLQLLAVPVHMDNYTLSLKVKPGAMKVAQENLYDRIFYRP